MLIVALGLVVGPIVGRKIILDNTKSLTKNPKDLFYLVQPHGLKNNDTNGTTETGTALAAKTAVASTTKTDKSNRIKLF